MEQQYQKTDISDLPMLGWLRVFQF